MLEIELLEKQKVVEIFSDLEKEKKILLDTIAIQNDQLKELKQLKNELISYEESYENFQNAMFVILYEITEAKRKKEMNDNELNQFLKQISGLAVYSLLEESIYDNYEDEISKGRMIAQRLTKFANNIKL